MLKAFTSVVLQVFVALSNGSLVAYQRDVNTAQWDFSNKKIIEGKKKGSWKKGNLILSFKILEKLSCC